MMYANEYQQLARLQRAVGALLAPETPREYAERLREETKGPRKMSVTRAEIDERARRDECIRALEDLEPDDIGLWG